MEESTPVVRVSALIVSYNSAPALRRSLTALEASQGREQLEIIVVDCGSADESPTLDTEFSGVTILRLERNFGATKACNIGMRTAAADYVFFLAPEVLVQPDTVMALAARLDADESVTAVAPLLVDESGEPRTRVRKLPSPEAMPLVWREPDRLPTAAVDTSAESVAVGYPGREALMVRKQFIRAFNWLDDRYGEFGGDLEVAFQIRRANRKALLIPAIRATLIAAEPLGFDTAALATLSADRAHGAAVFLGKHFGWLAGFQFRLSAIFHTLGQLLSFRQPGFQFRVLSALLSGQKIDGSQRSL
jgi:GT2 family glycosyltransferase